MRSADPPQPPALSGQRPPIPNRSRRRYANAASAMLHTGHAHFGTDRYAGPT
ncbi:hypothetical protein [Micromonospora sp. IBHARD004]|uniref:hypothetical protein n=1 Tax=Micromonospora sp. IBHARD004 TaxID=3457764 RepID=UPI004059905F